jgi:hypothetical protein
MYMKCLCWAAAALVFGLTAPSVALGQKRVPPPVSTFTFTPNLHPLGFSPRPNVGEFPNPAAFTANSDLAFRGRLAFQGMYEGFRIVDVSAPANPRVVSTTTCVGNQGDVVVYGNILIRSWNTPASATNPTATLSCDGQPVPVGFEGIHVFDISNLKNPVLVQSVELSARPMAVRGPDHQNGAIGCGSHTDTVAPDLANNRLIVYNQTSGGPCPFIGIIEVPLDNPAGARWLRNEPLNELGPTDAGHDEAVILGDANLLAVAAHDMAHVYDIGDNAMPGGSLQDPNFLYTIEEEGVCNQPGPDPQRPCNGNWHSAAFTWDGKVIIMGWEPGGGGQPECEASDPDVKKSWFFYDARTGRKLGQFVLPRPQSAIENCTIHNYNVVPTDKRYLLVGGNYQAGFSVVEFTDPANAREVAFADPAPLPLNPDGTRDLGGDWSTYWYNGRIYANGGLDRRGATGNRGLDVFRLGGSLGDATRTAKTWRYSNPQTQEAWQAP